MPRPRAQSTHTAAGTFAANFLEDLDPFAWDFLSSCSPQWMPAQWARAASVVEALQRLLMDEDTQRPTQLEYYNETWGLRAGRHALVKLHATAVRLLSRDDSGISRASADTGSGGGSVSDSASNTLTSRRALEACSRAGLAVTHLLRVLFSLAAFGRLMKVRGFSREETPLLRATDDVVRACISSDMLECLSRLVIFGRFQDTTEHLRWIGAAACLVEYLAYLSRERLRMARATAQGIATFLGFARHGIRRAQPLPFEIMEAIDRSCILQHLARAVLLVRQPRHHHRPACAPTPSHPNPPDATTAATEGSSAALGSGSTAPPGSAATANVAAASSNGSGSRTREAAVDVDSASEGDAVDAEEEGDALRAVMQALHAYVEVCDAMEKDDDWNGTTKLDVTLQYVWLAHVASQLRAAERSCAANGGGNRRNGGGGGGGVDGSGGGGAGGAGLGRDGTGGASSGDAGGSSSSSTWGATGTSSDGTVYGLRPELLPAPVLECCGGCSRPGCKAAVKVLRTDTMRCVLRYWVRAMEDGEPQIVGPAGKFLLSMRLAAVATVAWRDWHDAKEAEAKAGGATAAADAGPSLSFSSALPTATAAGGSTPAAAPKRPLTQKQLRQVQQQQAKQVKQQQQSRGKQQQQQQQQQDAEEDIPEITGPPKHVVPGGLRPEGCPLLALDALITASQTFLFSGDELDAHLAVGSGKKPGSGPSREQGQDACQERGKGQGGETASAGGSSAMGCSGKGCGGKGGGGGGLGDDSVVHGVSRPPAWWRVIVSALWLLPSERRALTDAIKHGSLPELMRQVMNRPDKGHEDDEEGSDDGDDDSGSYETVDSYDTDEDAEELARSRFNDPNDRAVGKSRAAVEGSRNMDDSGGVVAGLDEEGSPSDEPHARRLCHCHLRRRAKDGASAAASHSGAGSAEPGYGDRGGSARRRDRHICVYADFKIGVPLGLVPVLERLLRRGMPQLLLGPNGHMNYAIRVWVDVCEWSGLQPLLEHAEPRQGLSLLLTAAKVLQLVLTSEAQPSEEISGVPTMVRSALPDAILENLMLHSEARCGNAGSASGTGARGAKAPSADAAAVASSEPGGSSRGCTLATRSGGGEDVAAAAADRQGSPTQQPPGSSLDGYPHRDVLFASFAAARLLPTAAVLLRQLSTDTAKALDFCPVTHEMLQACIANEALLWVQLVCRAYQLALASGESAAAADWRGLLLTGADVFGLLDAAASLPEPTLLVSNTAWYGSQPAEALALVFPEEMAAAMAPRYAQVIRPAAAAEGKGLMGKRARTPPPPALSLRDALRHSLGPGGRHSDVGCLRRLRLLWQWRNKGCSKGGADVGDKDAAARRAAVAAVQYRLDGLTEAASLLVPPHVVSRLLPACANPCCSNLSRDSEAEVPLTVRCADCGLVSYCSAGCRDAYGRLGHKDVCAAMRAASEGRGQQRADNGLSTA